MHDRSREPILLHWYLLSVALAILFVSVGECVRQVEDEGSFEHWALVLVACFLYLFTALQIFGVNVDKWTLGVTSLKLNDVYYHEFLLSDLAGYIRLWCDSPATVGSGPLCPNNQRHKLIQHPDKAATPEPSSSTHNSLNSPKPWFEYHIYILRALCPVSRRRSST